MSGRIRQSRSNRKQRSPGEPGALFVFGHSSDNRGCPEPGAAPFCRKAFFLWKIVYYFADSDTVMFENYEVRKDVDLDELPVLSGLMTLPQ